MAFSINRVTLVGNVSSDPQLTYTPKGTALLKFSLATNWSRKNDAGEWEDVPSFHRVTVWSKLAEYLGGNMNKGDKIYVDGRIEYGSYEKDGITRYTTDIIAQNVIPMVNKGGRSTGQQNQSMPPTATSPINSPGATSGVSTQAPTNSSSEPGPTTQSSKNIASDTSTPSTPDKSITEKKGAMNEKVPADDIPF